MREKLEDWFYKTIDPKHYVLETGDHTNIYLNCRTLISDQSLMRQIALFLNSYFEFKHQKIDCVLAVGTSAIPIAINYQIYANCSSTFTMSKNNPVGFDNVQEDYIPTEIIPIIHNSKNILIIDDIISIGNVTRTIVNEYLNKTEVENIFHFSIFRLGSRKIAEIQKVKKFLWLCHFPWVYYSGGNHKKCEYCLGDVEKVFEHKM